ncbi:MAG: hypothetical protein IKU55_06065 [Clostridia bacterium]|nr:hypothetical protein [Clostridia bacterium]
MVGKDLKKLSRRELVDIIYQMKKNEQQMQEELAALQEALQDKRIRVSEVGTIAAAAASITDVFSAAQATADLYLHEIACRKEETEQECAKMLEEANNAVTKIFADKEQEYTELRARNLAEYRKLLRLREEIRVLEAQKQGSDEDNHHGKES